MEVSDKHIYSAAAIDRAEGEAVPAETGSHQDVFVESIDDGEAVRRGRIEAAPRPHQIHTNTS